MIKVENLTKEFKIKNKEKGLKGALKGLFSNDFSIKTAVDDISFEIEKGEVVGYIGSNGAGKSTTIKMMTGILTPTSGNITVNGIVPYKEREKNAKDIGVVFGQRTQLWWDLALVETFDILKDIYEIPLDVYERNMKFLNEILELDEFIKRPVRTLSLGQRMRADIAASLLHSPKILYLDEPTIGLDIVVKERVRNAIKKINKEFDTTIILTTHDLSDIEELCERIIIIDDGRKIYDGSLLELKSKFGYMITLEGQINSSSKMEVDLNAKFNLDKEALEYSIEKNKITIKFNKNKVSRAEVLGELMNSVELLDFTLKETSIDEIIKKIYTNEV